MQRSIIRGTPRTAKRLALTSEDPELEALKRQVAGSTTVSGAVADPELEALKRQVEGSTTVRGAVG